jgi:hypothetical protein
MSKTIEAMPEEVKDRFKALKVLYVSIFELLAIRSIILFLPFYGILMNYTIGSTNGD